MEDRKKERHREGRKLVNKEGKTGSK